MAVNLLEYKPQGDKKNSDMFEEYRSKIYQRRKSSGVEDLLTGTMAAVIIQVEAGDAHPYMMELYIMTPYRFMAAFTNSTHHIYFLEVPGKVKQPLLILLEPLHMDYEDESTRLNMLYPNARKKRNARYVGEVFHCEDTKELVKVLMSHEIRFAHGDDVVNDFFHNNHFRFTILSDFTCNRVGYTSFDLRDIEALDLGRRIHLSAAEQRDLDKVDAKFKELGFEDKLLGFDHMATRILAGEREDAILEFLTMSSYYFWGAYNIADMNSSTNVTRNNVVDDDKQSPAKVFTANNTPSYVNSFEGLPMPTEDFVRNYGRRMHHVAVEVRDADHPSGQKNVDYVVDTLTNQGIPFLAHVVGECKDVPDLKQIFSKHSPYSLLITEYIERCHHFKGFFTKQNVADMTAAAGEDERYDHGHVWD
jgi:hypothetical protein